MPLANLKRYVSHFHFIFGDSRWSVLVTKSLIFLTIFITTGAFAKRIEADISPLVTPMEANVDVCNFKKGEETLFVIASDYNKAYVNIRGTFWVLTLRESKGASQCQKGSKYTKVYKSKNVKAVADITQRDKCTENESFPWGKVEGKITVVAGRDTETLYLTGYCENSD
jgi:hypothetical protein